ncbi:unnamed protein product [Sphenostylis stenocarpa]|uniref:Vacuolar membrane protease n=1 Tax=Sphenostylis stenocarpa TaxID=92480 RepID=A0AA87BBL8_9FABA|nr:unnamed protein product [Sphenostylis stenocarpa]
MHCSAMSKVGSAASKVASSVALPGSGKKGGGFSEEEALKHVKVITEITSHPPSQDHTTPVLQYILDESERIKENANGDVEVEVERLSSEDGDSVAVKVSPKNLSPQDNHILVSAHVDTVFSQEGAGDDTSSVAVMLELARAISQPSVSVHKSVVFVFNGGDMDAPNASHTFLPEKYSQTTRLAIDLDSIGTTAGASKHPVVLMSKIGEEGIGGAQKLFLDLEVFSSCLGGKLGGTEDLFSLGAVKSAADFDVFKAAGGVSDIDFQDLGGAGAGYHTMAKNINHG